MYLGGDRQSERTNQSLETYLRLYCDTQQQEWSKLLPLAQYVRNSWPNATTKQVPFNTILGYTPTAHQPTRMTDLPTLQKRLNNIKESRSAAQEAMIQSQERTQQGPTHFKEYQEGDQVWLEGTNLKRIEGTLKLSPRWYRPFRVAAKVSHIAYKINLPDHWKIHNVFHASLLTPYRETKEHGPNFLKPPPDIIDDSPEWEVERILKQQEFGRWKKKQYLIRWKGYSLAHDSWVNQEDMHADDLLQEFSKTPRPTIIKAAETEDDLIIPHIVNLPPLTDNLLIPNFPMTNNELEINNSSAPASPVMPLAEPSPASPISIDSTTRESPSPSGDSPNAARGLGSPRSTSLSPIDYYGPNAHPQHCSSIPRPKLAELGVFCAGVHQYCTRHGDTPPALVQPGIFHNVNSVGTLQYIQTLGCGEDPLLFNYPAWRAALHSINELLVPYLHSAFSPTASPIRPDSPALPIPEPTFHHMNTPHPAGALLARIGDIPFIPRPPSSLNDSDQENRPDDPALEDWMEYDPLDPSHYSV
jgi:hypothetical protein